MSPPAGDGGPHTTSHGTHRPRTVLERVMDQGQVQVKCRLEVVFHSTSFTLAFLHPDSRRNGFVAASHECLSVIKNEAGQIEVAMPAKPTHDWLEVHNTL